MKILKFLLATVVAITLFCHTLSAQGVIGSGTTLYPVNSTLGLSPLNFGIGTNAPTHQLHTTTGVRFQGLTFVRNTPTFIMQADKLGVLSMVSAGTVGQVLTETGAGLAWKTPAAVANVWSVLGNAGTNPTLNYLGTSDNQRLVFRTNALEQATILTNGYFGLGTPTPTAQLHTTGDIRFQRMSGVGDRLIQTDALGLISPVSVGTTGQVLTQSATGLAWTTPAAASGWQLTGNTAPAGSFIGTNAGSIPLMFKSMGIHAGLFDNANANTFMGLFAGAFNTTGRYNTFFGHGSGGSNANGSYNVSVGTYALANNTSGMQNTAIGSEAMLNITTGTSNVAVGASALKANQTGNSNVAIGPSSLEKNTSAMRTK